MEEKIEALCIHQMKILIVCRSKIVSVNLQNTADVIKVQSKMESGSQILGLNKNIFAIFSKNDLLKIMKLEVSEAGTIQPEYLFAN